MKALKDKIEFNFLSREGVFFVAMLAFAAWTVAILFYTMLPAISELMLPTKFTVPLESYNTVTIPFMVLILFLSAMGPMISYSSTPIEKLAKEFFFVFIFGVVVTLYTVILGYTHPAGIILTLVTSFSLAAFLLWAIKLFKGGGIEAIFKSRRAFGAIIIHLGLVMMAYGVIFSAFYHRSADLTVSPHSSFQFERYTIQVDTVYSEQVRNYISNFVPLTVFVGERRFTTLYPEIRQYEQNLRRGDTDRVYAEVAYHSTITRDLYIILNGYDMGQDLIRITVIIQPLVIWIWLGCLFMCIGGFYGMTQNAAVNSPVRKDK
jgi:cytochrome c-type biogenesis protein CcmF